MKNKRRIFEAPFFCFLSFTCCVAVAAAERNAGVPVVIGAPPEAATAIDPKAAPATRNDKPARLSAGLDEILKLTKAGVEESVVLAFIQNSPIAYYPTADEIVILRERGLSAPVLAALLQHGTEVRQRDAAAGAAADNLAPAPAPAPEAPATTNPPPVPEPVRVHTASSPTVTYSGEPSYSYGVGYYPYYYGGWFPSFSVGIGFGGYGGHCGYYGGHVSTVHGSGGFHGGGHH